MAWHLLGQTVLTQGVGFQDDQGALPSTCFGMEVVALAKNLPKGL